MWAGLVAAAAGMFLTALDITVNVALPAMTDPVDRRSGFPGRAKAAWKPVL